jgi:hypothetical protein
MKTIKSVNIGSFVLYAALLAAFWTFVFGLVYWILGWIFGARSFWIDMNLINWTGYTLATFFSVIWRSVVNGLIGALAGLVLALVYNLVAGAMGGLKINVE